MDCLIKFPPFYLFTLLTPMSFVVSIYLTIFIHSISPTHANTHTFQILTPFVIEMNVCSKYYVCDIIPVLLQVDYKLDKHTRTQSECAMVRSVRARVFYCKIFNTVGGRVLPFKCDQHFELVCLPNREMQNQK